MSSISVTVGESLEMNQFNFNPCNLETSEEIQGYNKHCFLHYFCAKSKPPTFTRRSARHYSPADNLPGRWLAERSDRKELNQPNSASRTLQRAAWKTLSGNKPNKKWIIRLERLEGKLIWLCKSFQLTT